MNPPLENWSPPAEEAFFQKINLLVNRIGIETGLRTDLAQETWLRCLEYSRRSAKPLALLSSHEIRLRCLEARRKVMPDRRSVLQAFLPEPEATAEPEEPSSKTDLFDEIIDFHPVLRLTPLQKELWSIQRDDPDGRWKAAKARETGCSRQNIANITHVVQHKMQQAIELVHLLEGDLLPFFERIDGWADTPVQSLLWSVLRPKSGDPFSPLLQRRFEAIEDPMLELALQIIETEQREMGSGRPLDSRRLRLAYNILISAFQIRPEGAPAKQCLDELTAKVSSQSWLLHRFVSRAGHLASPRLREAHREWLKERILLRDQEGLYFASYAIAYYGGATPEEVRHLLEGDGKVCLKTVGYEPVIKRLYDNIQIPRYNTSEAWMDINILRIVLMEEHFPFAVFSLSVCGKNTLTILCQKSLHSNDPFVVERAGRFLYKLQRDGSPSSIE